MPRPPPPPSRAELARLYDACLRLNDGRLLLEGVAARAGVPTQNGRVYGAGDLRRVARRYQRAVVARGLALGELDHPSYASLSLYRSVSLANVSHVVLRLEWRGAGGGGGGGLCGGGGSSRRVAAAGNGELIALVEVLPTPSGLLLWEMAARGVPLAISQRCWAEVEWRRQPGGAAAPENRQQQQQQQQQQQPRQQLGFVCGASLELLAFDFVPDPANAGAWMRPVARHAVGGAADPSAVALAHLGAGAVSPARAAAAAATTERRRRGGAALPTAEEVVEALLRAAAAETAGAQEVGALELTSHYADAFGAEGGGGGQGGGGSAEAAAAAHEDDDDEQRRQQLQQQQQLADLAALVARGAPPESKARSLPAHWRRYAERALRCEARERARREGEEQQQDDNDDDEEESERPAATCCLPLGAWRRQWRLQQRARRRRMGASSGAAAVAPLRARPEEEEGDGLPAGAGALLPPPAPPQPPSLADGLEVEAVLGARAAKARDVRRQVLMRRVAMFA